MIEGIIKFLIFLIVLYIFIKIIKYIICLSKNKEKMYNFKADIDDNFIYDDINDILNDEIIKSYDNHEIIDINKDYQEINALFKGEKKCQINIFKNIDGFSVPVNHPGLTNKNNRSYKRNG